MRTIIAGCLLALLAGAVAAQPPEAPRKKVAILVFDGVQIIDFTAPYEVFAGRFDVFTVAPRKETIATAQGLAIVPDHDFATAPAAEVVVVPGGGRHDPEAKGPFAHALPTHDPAVFAWVRGAAQKAEIVLSVCNGAFILAEAGLLDGLEATTTASLIDTLKLAKATRVRDDRRFVDNGKIVTAAGLTSGIDASLHVVERVFGRGTAQLVALGLEYNWDPEGRWTRAALADRYMRFDFQGFDEASWTPLSRLGDTEKWQNRWTVTMDRPAHEVLRLFEQTLEANRTWVPTQVRWSRAAAVAPEARESAWTFTDESGRVWRGRASVEPGEAPRQHVLALEIRRDGERPAAASASSSR